MLDLRSLAVRRDLVGRWPVHALVSDDVVQPSGPPLLVIHGLGMSSRYLVPTLEALAGRHRVYAPDLPGCGRSGRPEQQLDLGALADAVVRWMDVLNIECPLVVGHSIGAQVAAHIATRHPDRARALVLASPTGDPDIHRWVQAAALLGNAAREERALIPLAIRDYVRAGPIRMWRTYLSTRRDDVLALVARLQHRCIVVRGADDLVVSDGWARAVADAAHALELVTIPSAPHGLPYSAAQPFAAVIDEFASSYGALL